MPVEQHASPVIPPFGDLGELRFSLAVQERYRTLAELRALVKRTVSTSRLWLDAGLLGATAVLSAITLTTGLPAPSIGAFILLLGYGVPRLLLARQALNAYAVLADDPVTVLAPIEKERLPLPLHAPADARTLGELDRMLRPSTFLISLRGASVMLVCFWIVALVNLGFITVSLATNGPEIGRVAAVQMLVATLVPHVVASLFAWANQRHVNAIFDQAQRVLAVGHLPAGDLDPEGAIRLLANGSTSIDPKRLLRTVRPRRRTSNRPPALPVAVFGMGVLMEVLTLSFAFAPPL